MNFQKISKKNYRSIFQLVILIVVIFALTNTSIFVKAANEVSNDIIFYERSEDGTSIKILPNAILLKNNERISNTGINSSHSRIQYNHESSELAISWTDLVRPFTPTADSTIYYTIGTSESWISPLIIDTINDDTLTKGYIPTLDMNDATHLIFEEFSVDNYDIQEVMVEEDNTVLPKTAVISNSGNSTNPTSVSDEEGIVHLVWRDTTDNANGDLYYTNYNATIDTWLTPTVRITNSAEIIEDSSPTLAIDENNTIHLVWADNRTGDQELYYSYLDDGGTWSAEVKITNVGYKPMDPVIAYNSVSKELQVLFRDRETTTKLWFIEADAKSTSVWSSPNYVTENLISQSDFDISIDQNGNTIAVFEILVNGFSSIYLRHKPLSGSWQTALRRISTINVNAYDPSITVDENGIYYIVYTELYQNAFEVFFVNGYIDSDGDELSDYEEINVYGTDPNLVDTDGDTISDGEEVTLGLDGVITNPLSSDSDSDQIPDDYEILYNLNPNNASDADLDFDDDDLTNLEEYQENTNPLIFDTDGDTLGDGEEINDYSTDPLKADTDGDKLIDGYEVLWGLDPNSPDNIETDPDGDGLTTEFESTIWTNPNDPDTDGDGFYDGVEYQFGTDPLDPADFPEELRDPRDYTNIIIGVVIGAATLVVFLTISIIIAQQFKPKKATKRKELELEHSQLFTKEKEKGRKMEFEQKEKQKMDDAVKKRFEELLSDIPEEQKISTETKKPVYEIPKKEEIDPNQLNEKKEEMKRIILVLDDYLQQLLDLQNKKMTEHTLLTASREGLTEFATESQRLFSEAKTLWNSSILPLIKGYEEELVVDTLEAEKLIDQCETTSNKILDILVQRELAFTEDEERKEDVRDKARKALEAVKEDEEEKEETQENELDSSLEIEELQGKDEL